MYGPAPTRMPSFPRVRAMAGKTKICDFSYLRRIAAESARRRGSSEFGKGETSSGIERVWGEDCRARNRHWLRKPTNRV